ncbi:MAG: hypothetical protein KatS3mg083_272 [Candidatus Dojkabacteria bacterium]|nr:MAG: hypothetical protein KatS3mg083_272 [Candidatus Dojkabacteria bacterium]
MATKEKAKKNEKKQEKRLTESLNVDLLIVVIDQNEMVAPHIETIKVAFMDYLKEVILRSSGLKVNPTFYTIHIDRSELKKLSNLDLLLEKVGYASTTAKAIACIDNPFVFVMDKEEKVVYDTTIPSGSFSKALWFVSIMGQHIGFDYGFFVGNPLYMYVFGEPKIKLYRNSYLYTFPLLVSREEYRACFRDLSEMAAEIFGNQEEEKKDGDEEQPFNVKKFEA